MILTMQDSEQKETSGGAMGLEVQTQWQRDVRQLLGTVKRTKWMLLYNYDVIDIMFTNYPAWMG